MSWIQTYTGRQFWPLDPVAEEINLGDIAHALALKCRYTGHCREFYSVAQHSVLVSRMVPAADALWGLLHDAAEAYLPDVARPIKAELFVRLGSGLYPFDLAERRILTQVAAAFDLRYAMPSTVKAADLCALERERRQLLGPPPADWATAEHWDGDRTPIVPLGPAEAELLFLGRFAEITLEVIPDHFQLPEITSKEETSQ